MSGDVHVRICESLGVRFPWATRLVVRAKSQQAIAQACPVVTTCLGERGLVLHQDKTHMRHRTEGFAFLGFPSQRRGQKRLITPQKQQVEARLRDVRFWLKTPQSVSSAAVLRHLNPLLRGGAMSYRHVVSKQTFQHVDYPIWSALWPWAKRRHPTQSRRWTYRRSCEKGTYGATCSAESRARRGTHVRLRLERIPARPMVRHVKVQGTASPDNPGLQTYWTTRRIKMGRQRLAKGRKRYQLAEAQRWQCQGCGQTLFDGQEVHIHHTNPVHAGGSDAVENLPWLHRACHYQQHRQEVTSGQSA